MLQIRGGPHARLCAGRPETRVVGNRTTDKSLVDLDSPGERFRIWAKENRAKRDVPVAGGHIGYAEHSRFAGEHPALSWSRRGDAQPLSGYTPAKYQRSDGLQRRG